MKKVGAFVGFIAAVLTIYLALSTVLKPDSERALNTQIIQTSTTNRQEETETSKKTGETSSAPAQTSNNYDLVVKNNGRRLIGQIETNLASATICCPRRAGQSCYYSGGRQRSLGDVPLVLHVSSIRAIFLRTGLDTSGNTLHTIITTNGTTYTCVGKITGLPTILLVRLENGSMMRISVADISEIWFDETRSTFP